MNRSQIVIIAVAMLAVVAVAAMVTMSSSSEPQTEKDVTGHWYAVDCKMYDSEGTYTHTSITDSTSMDLDIYYTRGGTFTGWGYKQNISGSIIDGKVTFATYTEEGSKVVSNGKMVGDYIYIVAVYITPDGSDEKVSVVNTLLCKDNADTGKLPELDSMTGDWYFADGEAYNGSVMKVTEGKSLRITAQNGTIFKGYMGQNDSSDKTTESAIRGAISYFRNGVGIGLIIDDQGNIWDIQIQQGVIHLETVMEFDQTPKNGGIGVGTVHMSFSQNPNATIPERTVDYNYAGTTWSSLKTEIIDPYGNVSIEGTRTFLKMVDQTANNIHGIEYTSTGEVPFIVCNHKSEEGQDRYINTESGMQFIYSDTQLVDANHMNLYLAHDISGVIYLEVRYLERFTENMEFDITGHWYATQRVGYNQSGEYIMESILQEKDLREYDLDIFVDNDDLFRGWFMNRYVVGYCDDKTIILSGTSENIEYRIEGTLNNSNSIVFNEVYYNSDTKKISGYTTHFTRDRGAVITDEVNLNFVGQWTMTRGASYYANDTVPLEMPQNLTVQSMKNGAFIGTMDVKNSQGELESMGFKGVVLPSIVTQSASGLIIGEDGQVWLGAFTDDSMYITRSGKSVNPEHLDEAGTVEKLFCRIGHEADLELPSVDLKGRWESTKTQMICVDGSYGTEGEDYVLIVENQTNNIALGPSSCGMLVGAFSLTMKYIGNKIALNFSMDFGSGVDLGTGTLLDEDHFVIIESYTDPVGKQWIQKTTFERRSVS